jgi:serine/threonine protein kinase
VSRTAGQNTAPPDLPGYRFASHIGSGGNARVYLYEQDLPRRRVAVKVLNESALSEAARRRFTDEANVTAGLAHRHIVQVFEANVTADGRPYLVMPYYPQPNLLIRARRSRFSVAEVLRVGIQIGGAVETSHRGGVLHRDIKPQNILTDSYGEPVLTDFGIATTTGGDGPEGLSVPWSPPEILYGTLPGDQRADVYSLGATLWHLLVGRSPFEEPGGDNSTFALMGRVNTDQPPSTGRADVPDSLDRLLRRAMAKDPAGRPQTAMELIRSLQAVEQELRLPLTQPILPADEPSGDTQVGDTVVRPQARQPAITGTATDTQARSEPQPPGQAIESPGDGAANPQARGAFAVRENTADRDGAADGTAHLAAGPEHTAEDPTRKRALARLTPWDTAGQPGQADDDTPTRLRALARLDPLGAPAGAAPAGTRSGETPPEAPEEATVLRASVPQEKRSQAGGTARTGPRGARSSGRAFVLAGGGVLVAAVAVVAVLALRHGGGPAAASTVNGQASQQAGGQSALGPGAAAPGQPAVTERRVSGMRVEFSWTYANPAAGDTFRWQEVSGGRGEPIGVVAKPQLLLTVAKGQSACITVTVRSADGQASQPSEPACWSN